MEGIKPAMVYEKIKPERQTEDRRHILQHHQFIGNISVFHLNPILMHSKYRQKINSAL